jgi:hypothetical protein
MKPARKYHRSAFAPATRLTRRVRLIFIGALFLSLTITALYIASPPPAEAIVSTSIVISQVYGGGGNSGAQYKNDFIELYNLGTTTVNLSGWSVQYASDTGSSWQVTNLSGSLAPGRYYLVQEAGGANGAALPAPSATDNIAMSATSGKVALVNNTTALTGTCPSGVSIIDFVGYGPTSGINAPNCFEGAGPAPALSNTTADIRKNGGNQDTDNNNLDFTAAAPFPRSGVFNANSSIAPDSSSHACQFFDLLAGPSFSWQHTIGSGSNRLLMVGVSTETVTAFPALVPIGVAAPRVASVTLTNGSTITSLTRVDDTLARDATNQTQVEMFRLLEAQMPPPGTYTITVTLALPNATSVYAVGGAVSFFGVDQTTPFNTGQNTSALNTFAENKGNSNAPSVTVISGSNEYVLDTVSSVYTGAGAAILSTNNPLQTEQWNGGKSNCFGTGVLDSIGAGSTRPGASPSIDMQWSINSAKPWAIGAVSIRPASTLVELASFEAEKRKSGVALQWRTGYEVNNLGFNLYREQNGKRVQVNPSIIAGSAFLIGQGAAMTAGDSYSWFDPQGTSDSIYYLEDVDLNGTRKLNGPVTPTSYAPSGIKTDERQAMLLSELNAQAATTSGISKWQKGWPAYNGSGRELLYDINDKPGFDLQRLIASQGAIKLSINKEGWYRVTQADLVAAGFNESVDARMLRLYTNGVEVPLLMNAAKQQFSPGDSFEFYGSGLDTPTTDTNTYWLVTGNGKGLRITPQTRSATSTQMKTSSVTLSQPTVIVLPPRLYTQPEQGKGAQGLQASPPASGKPLSASREFPLDLIVSPTAATTPSVSVSGKPENEVVSVPKAAATTKDSVTASTSVPAKKSRRRMKRTRRPRRKTASHNHVMLRPVAAQSYSYTVELKERLIYVSSLINGETENFYGKVIGSSSASEQLILDNVDKGFSGTAQLEIALQGYTLVNHQVKVKVNDQQVGTLSFTGQDHPVTKFSLPQSALHEGENIVTLERAGGDTDFSLVDYIRLTYEHSYRADNDLLRLTTEGSTRVDGFTSGNIRVMDISDPLRIREIACTVETSSGNYAATFQATREGEYIAFTDDKTSRPASIELDKPSNLKSSDNNANLVIISHADFIGSVQPLAELRRKEGLAVSVVDVQDIYDEFSYGAHSPYAIKDFLSWAKTHWQKSPEFVLLVGDAGIDPKNYLGGGLTDFVPTKLIDASTMETASDDWLADFNQDGIAEMAVGRLPVRSKAEADQVVSKITGYSPGNALQQVLMVVDKNNANDTFSFEQYGQALGSLVPSSLNLKTINRASISDDAAHTEIISGINQGPLMVNYIGHGSVEVWTGAPILSTTDTSALTNSNHLPVFVMMTCLNGYFPNPSRESLAEALLRSNAGGAVAVWASSGMTEPNAQSQMNRQFYQNVFGADSIALGIAVQKAKEGVGDRDVRRTWILFGDPTMRIK